MAVIHKDQRAKAESGYIVSGSDATKLADYLFNQTTEQVKKSIKNSVIQIKESKEIRKKLLASI